MKRIAITLAIVTCFAPAVVRGQAGLFWDNSEKMRNNAGNGWDSGNKGTSALGQLESIAGRKVDTSRVPAASQPQQVEQAQPKVVHKPHTLSTSQQLGVFLFGAVLENVLSSDNNVAAKAQALEQQRIAAELKRQEELRKARILHSQWRAEWDNRDQATTEQLAGVFDAAPATSRSTSFFGIPGGADLKSLLPDVDLSANDSSVVQLPDRESLTVHPLNTSPARLRQPVATTESVIGSEVRDSADDRFAPARLITQLYWKHGVDAVKERLLEFVPEIPGLSTLTSIQEYKEAYDEKRNLLSNWNQRKLELAGLGAEGVISGKLDPEHYWQLFQKHSGEEKNSYLESAVNELDSHASE